ncbi:MAG TPA: glycosyltransferase [Burkholderiales bacterium]
MKVSIVVPAFNEERLLATSLRVIQESRKQFEKRGWSTELIVCDNNSTDRTAEIARAAGAQVVFEPVNQISRARNAGAAAATGDWLVFIDADSAPSPELFSEVCGEIEGGKTVAGGSTVAFREAALAPRLALGAWNVVSRAARWAAGSFMFCETAAFRRVGGFSEELFASEELDLYRRLKRLARREGRRIVILHRHPIVTSARKAELYTWGEMGLFVFRTLLAPKRTLRSREACYSWYDGRR